MNQFSLMRCNDEVSYLQMHDIREKVLFTTVKYDRQHPDDRNPNNHCFIFLLDEIAVGTVRLDFFNSHNAALRLVAILSEYQGRKIGSKMLNAIEDYAKHHSINKLFTNARHDAEKFYLANGFKLEEWIDPGEGSSQPTIAMVKNLDNSP